MKSHIILFDIDYTLFNTQRFKKNTSEYICTKFHISDKDMKVFDKDYRSKVKNPAGVNMKDFTEKMAVWFSLSSINLYQLLMDTSEIFTETLYPDVLPSLTHLSEHYVLGVFSQGHFPFQENKLKKTNIIHMFDKKHTYIHPDKTHEEHLQKIPKNAIIIDDKVSVVDSVSKHVHAIHIDRENILGQSNFPIIHSLNELPEAIKCLLSETI